MCCFIFSAIATLLSCHTHLVLSCIFLCTYSEERGVPSCLLGERPGGAPDETSSDSNDSPPAQIPIPPPGDPPQPELPSR